MHATAPPPTGRGTLAPAAALLRKAAAGYRTGQITWGRNAFIGDDGCRCLVAAITWAADPTDADNGGNPFWLRNPHARLAAQTAVAALAEHLTCQLGWPWRMDGDEYDLNETLGAWNDDADRTLADVIGELEIVAEGIRPAALDGAR